MSFLPSFKILESDAQIENMILREIARQANQSFSKLKVKAINPIRQTIRSAMSSHPAISSLSGGKLRADFGIPSGADVVTAIIEQVVSSVDMTVIPVSAGRGTLKGGITLTAQPTDYMNVLSLPGSNVVTEKGEVLPWLDWLLLKGDTIIVATYGVKYKGGTGRSGQATMKLNYNSPYKVDSQFSGTAGNNFITESIESTNDEIMSIIARYI